MKTMKKNLFPKNSAFKLLSALLKKKRMADAPFILKIMVKKFLPKVQTGFHKTHYPPVVQRKDIINF